ncbi:MAG: acyl-CoA thioesterase [Desulfitobacteriaceae bacterium]|nr:acyl-CoA thioesterase [Desulfitobacteriaceae bacterium]MDD4402259.1 acyl-CoA thioesterase [Desulfitobacteriaceae bacterium]
MTKHQNMEPRSASLSQLTMTQVIMPEQTNPFGNTHGGDLVKLMDNAAGVVAIRHSSAPNMLTAGIDNLVFKRTIRVGDLIFCNAEIIYTGRTSIGLYVTVTVEKVKIRVTKPAVEGYWFMVAADKNGKPTPVPPLKIENKEQELKRNDALNRLKRLKEVSKN